MEITENNYDRISNYPDVKEGSVWFSPGTNRLILDNSKIYSQTSYPTIENHSNENLIIQLIGTNQLDFHGRAEREALKLMKNTTIMSFESGAWLKSNFSPGGIYVGSGKTLTLQNASLSIPYLAGGNASTFLNMADNAYVCAFGHSKGTVRSLNVINKSNSPGVAVTSNEGAPDFIWNRASVPGVYTNKRTLDTTLVYMSTQNSVTWYPLSICGYRVNSFNYLYPINEFVEDGGLYFNKRTGVLELSGVTINYNDEWHTDPAIMWNNSSQSFGISLIGNNTIKTGDAEAISSTKDIVINKSDLASDEVSLTLTGKNPKLSATKNITIENVTVSAPELEADKLTVTDSKINITKNLNTNKDILNEMVVASTPEAPAYYDSGIQKVVAPNGMVELVPRSEVSRVYPITFCGTEINSANRTCVMNKYVKSGTVKVDKVLNKRYSVSLTDVRLTTNSPESVFDISAEADYVSFYLYGSNQFVIDYPSTHFISGSSPYVEMSGGWTSEAELVVYGSDENNAGAIAVPANGTFQVWGNREGFSGELNVTVPRVYGEGSSSVLKVESPYFIVSGNKQGTVKNIKCEPYNSAELYNTASTPREIRDDGIYSHGSICTENVKFVKNGESYIRVSKISIDKHSLVFDRKGQTIPLKATVLPNDATNKKIVWTSTNENVAKVDKMGKVTARGNGLAIVYATPAEGTATTFYYDDSNPVPLNMCGITVDIPSPTSIALDQTEALIDREGICGIYLTATLTPSNADTEYTWESSDESVVSVLRTSGEEALVRRIADEGEATITVTTKNGLQASCKVVIKYAVPVMVESVTLDVPEDIHISAIGETMLINATVLPENATDRSLTWYSSNPSVGTVDQSGNFTSTGYGSTKVAAFTNDGSELYQSVRIYVDAPPVIATDMKLPSVDPFYQLGGTIQLRPVFTPENVTNKDVIWESTDPFVATVDANGMVTIVDWGECFINATTTDGSNIKRSCWIQAIDPSSQEESVYATGIKLEQKEVTLLVGSETRVGVTIEPANYTESIMVELMEGDISVAEVREEWDWNTNRTSIYIRSDQMMGQAGDVKYVIRPNAADWEKLNAQGIWQEPADTLTIHVLAPIIFAEASPEDINITYHVTDINDKTCEVYTQPRPGMTMIDPLDPDLTPAVSQTATGMLTVPAKANGYWVTNVMPCAFNRCSGLTEIDFSEGIETIGDYACYSGLFSLQRVTLPSTIKELGQYCFSANPSDYATSEDPSGRNHIREVNIKSFTPPTGQNGSDINWSSAFYNVASDAVLYVPTGALANYNVEPWTQWFSRIAEKQFFEDPDGIKAIDNGQLTIDNEGAWYDLSGRKLGSKPAKAGLYIQGGKKVVIK